MKRGKELIDEINSTINKKDVISFWWLGQMGFAFKIQDMKIYIDPFLSDFESRLIEPPFSADELIGADYIIGSHNHLDHIDVKAWEVIAKHSKRTKFIVPRMHIPNLCFKMQIDESRFIGLDDDMMVSLGEIIITGIASAHEFLDMDADGRFPFLGYFIEYKGMKIYHAGDTCIYEGLYERLRRAAPDVMIVPINGRDAIRYKENIIGNMTYQEAVDLVGTVKPKLAVPAHYDMFKSNGENPMKFIEYLNAKYPNIESWVGNHGVRITINI